MRILLSRQKIQLLALCIGVVLGAFLAMPGTIHAQVSDPCVVYTIPYGQPIPSEQLFTSKAACEGGFLTQCLPDGTTVGQTGKCCSGKSYQSGNVMKCGASPVVATTCTVGGIQMSAGGTACGASGDLFEYVCVANGSSVGGSVDDTGAATLQRRNCKTGWACKNNACAPLFSDIQLGASPLPIVRSGEICNEQAGCRCSLSSSLSIPSQIKKFDVCGGGTTVASQATCTSQCVAGNSCPGTSTNGVGSCPVNFKCCAPLDNVDTQTTAQQQCVRAYNSTGQIGSLECERYLVSSGVTTQTEINSSRASRAVANTALDAVVGVAERVEINSVRFDAVTQALNQGKIDAVTASALYAYIAADLVTLGQLDATNNSVQFAKQQCQISTPAACAAHWAGAFGNSLLLSAEFVPKTPKAVVSTLTDPVGPVSLNQGLSSSDELTNTLTPTTESTNFSPCPLIFGISTDSESIAYEKIRGKILGCTFDPIEDALRYDSRTGTILDAQGNSYNTGSTLGSGAYSSVYAGQNNTVVKILNESVLSQDYAYDAALNQADFLLGVPQDSGYPNISRIIVDSEDQTLLRGLEMERIVGQSLEDFFAAGNTITANEADALVEELNRIHTVTGRAHGDLAVGGELVNPANIMIHEDGRILFLDPSGLNPQPLYTDYAKQSELNSLIQGLEPYIR